MQTYQIVCPLCDDTVPIELEDHQVIYFIEAHQSNPRQLFSWNEPEPDETAGEELLIKPDWVTTQKRQCDNGHHLFCSICHYDHVDGAEHRLYGPADAVELCCPSCQYRLGDHADHIVRLDSDPSMQYVLREIATEPNDNYKRTDAITTSKAGTYDQLSMTHDCPHCGALLYYNYSNRRVDQSETYQGATS